MFEKIRHRKVRSIYGQVRDSSLRCWFAHKGMNSWSLASLAQSFHTVTWRLGFGMIGRLVEILILEPNQ